MALTNDHRFQAHVDELDGGGSMCKFCGHKFAPCTSITRIKWHLSGEKGRGVAICKRVPPDVKEAAYLACHGSNKRQKSMPDSSNIHEATNPPASTSPQEQNNENANLTLSCIRSMLMEDSSTQQAANEITEAATADLVSLMADKCWDEIHASTASDALQSLHAKATSPKFNNMEQEYSEIKEWKYRLSLVNAVLDDAEEKQLANKSVRSWLSKLREIAYDAEDTVDEFETDTTLIEFRNAESQAGTSAAQKCAIPNPEVQSRLKKITARLDEIVKEKSLLDLGTSPEKRSNRVYNREPTTSLVKEPRVYGREKDKEAILEFLKNGEQGDFPYSVIPITGMGGVGKTTLAQLIYNDETIQFDCKAWVCISDDYDVIKITKEILQHWESCQDDNLNVLQVKLKEKLSSKKFLIVLDDVWERKYEKWTNLCGPFAAGAFGSKIIVTSRSEDVLSKRNSVTAYKLEGLPYDECLRLFAQYALDRENFDTHPDLKAVGDKIVERCKGLPLAAKTLGGLLHSKESVQEWEDTLNSKIWDLPVEESDILPALRLSYYHLPSHLKQCFSYCAIFPKDYEFEKEEMVLLWMAEGFLQQPEKNKQGQVLGHAYFEELLSRSFFQESSSSSNKSRYVMHDLMSDLAQFVSGETCFQLDDSVRGAKSWAKVRHSAFIPHHYDTWQRFEVFDAMKSLRTFISLPPSSATYDGFYLSSKVLDDLVPKLKCLRSLSLAGYRSLRELPNSILALKHLRYLDLSFTSIARLPESLGELLNLQTLKLCGCQYIFELPPCIGNLINLECLDVSGINRLLKMPPEIIKLKNLVILPQYTVGEGSGLEIGRLEKLPNLRGQLYIFGLHNIADIQEAKLAKLKEKQGLDELKLEWNHYRLGAQDESHEYQVLKSLQPHQSLRKLSVTCYGGTAFPSWIGDPIFTKLVDLQLYFCHRIISISPLGKLPALRNLVLHSMTEVKEVAAEGFPSLETLTIEAMVAWEQWSWCDGLNEKFPKLHTLTIGSCHRLVGNWPICLPSLRQLQIHICSQLADLPKVLPSLCELHIDYCQEVIFKSMHHYTSLTKLRFEKISGLVSLHEGFVQALDSLEDLVIQDCNELKCLFEDGNALGKLANLKSLHVSECAGLVSLVEGEEGRLPCNLQLLSVYQCDNLEKVPNGLYSLTSLRALRISRCRRLVSFPEGGLPCCLKILEIEFCDSLESLPSFEMTTTTMNGNKNQQYLLEEISIINCRSLKFPKGRGGRLPTTLKQLTVRGCDELKFPEAVFQVDDAHDNVSHRCPPHLEYLSIHGFSLTSFPTSLFPTSLKTLIIDTCKGRGWRLPTTLKQLTLQGCDELEFPEAVFQVDDAHDNVSHRCPPHLEYLSIHCFSVTSFPTSLFPTSLKTLIIDACKMLKSLPSSLHTLSHLTELTIRFCGELELFPDGGLDLPNLVTFSIFDCQKLRRLSNMENLTSLQTLTIVRCSSLESFPEWGFPPNLNDLQTLVIHDCSSLESFPEWGFPPNLNGLSISHCEKLTQQPMPRNWGLHVLTSLERLSIDFYPSGGSGMDYHFPDEDDPLLPTSLTSLEIYHHKHLRCISRGIQHLTSLKNLMIESCPNLKSLPKEGFPPTLESLCIVQCPLLKEGCLKEKGDYWPMIAHIPRVEISYPIRVQQRKERNLR